MCYFYMYYHYQKLYNQLHASQLINSFKRDDLLSRVNTFKEKVWNGTTNVIKSVPELEYCVYDVALSVSYDDNMEVLRRLVVGNQIIFLATAPGETEGDVVFETDGNFIRRNLYVTHQNLSGCKECLELALLRIQDENGQFRIEKIIEYFNEKMQPLLKYNDNYIADQSIQGTKRAGDELIKALKSYHDQINQYRRTLSDLYSGAQHLFRQKEVELESQATSIASQHGQLVQKVFNQQVWDDNIRDFLIQKLGDHANITKED